MLFTCADEVSKLILRLYAVGKFSMLPAGIGGRAGAAATAVGLQRNIGFLAACTSSSLLTRVECGALFTSYGVSSTSRAMLRIASMNKSSSSSDSLSVGSIISAP